MTEQVDIFFDYVCPYCFVACRREEILKRDLEVEFNWKGWEIFPDRSHECVARDDL
ncbi:MAG: DsbA family protein, partial [Thermoplasmata archaeon]